MFALELDWKERRDVIHSQCHHMMMLFRFFSLHFFQLFLYLEEIDELVAFEQVFLGGGGLKGYFKHFQTITIICVYINTRLQVIIAKKSNVYWPGRFL